MFDKVGVPSDAVVGNMLLFTVTDAGKSYRLFIDGHGKRLMDAFGFTNCYEMAVNETLCKLSYSGAPFFMAYPESGISSQYSKLATCVVRNVAKMKYDGYRVEDVTYYEKSNMITFIIKKKREA